ncbi:MAG: tRNA pseudouridine(55) synthase TruB [Bacteroidales bacterium]|nr:tRNA pseudouridine(55) synthase TruB [Bacteroidales bacterium]
MSYLTLRPGMALSHSIEDYPDGIVVVVDKPYRWTSADVIRKVKWMAIKHFHKKNLKVGHAGTLDPLATGVLLVCIGKATKLAESFQKERKQYVAGVTFGATTASYDREKEVDMSYPLDGVSEDALRAVLPSFIGEQDQVAPLFSAKSVDGVRVYELARKRYKAGLPVDDSDILKASRITIYDLQLLNFGKPPVVIPVLAEKRLGQESARRLNPSSRINVAEIPAGLPAAEIMVDCSKGTYIRALARDLGEALGSGAFLHSLRRTKNGSFTIDEALGIEELKSIFSI